MTYRSELSNPFEYNVFGKITGSSVATQFPDVECQLARIIAYGANLGNFYIGNTAARCFWELDAGVDTGWFGIDNLNNLFYSSQSGTADYIAWWIQK